MWRVALTVGTGTELREIKFRPCENVSHLHYIWLSYDLVSIYICNFTHLHMTILHSMHTHTYARAVCTLPNTVVHIHTFPVWDGTIRTAAYTHRHQQTHMYICTYHEVSSFQVENRYHYSHRLLMWLIYDRLFMALIKKPTSIFEINSISFRSEVRRTGYLTSLLWSLVARRRLGGGPSVTIII